MRPSPVKALVADLALKALTWGRGTGWAPWRGDLWGDACGGPVGGYGLGSLPGTRYDYRAAAGDFRFNASVAACIAWMQRVFPEARLKVTRPDETGKGEEVKNHPLARLLRRPNPVYSGDSLWQRTLPDWIATGNAYWVKVRTSAGRVVELWHRSGLRPVRDRDTDFISRYVETRGDQVTFYPVEDVIHFRFGQDPADEMRGWSPLEAGAREIATLNNGATYRGALLRTGVPAYGLVGKDAEVFRQLESKSEAWFAGIRARFRALFGGDNAGDLFIPSFPADLVRVGFSPQELDIREMLEWDCDTVCALLGLNSMVVGLPAGETSRTYANMGEAMRAALDYNIKPTQRLLAEDLEIQLLADFGAAAEEQIEWDYTNVTALQEDENEKWTRYLNAVKAGVLDANEARLALGYPAREEPEALPPPRRSLLAGESEAEPESMGDAAARERELLNGNGRR
jgi:HK97 family phage portal protein